MTAQIKITTKGTFHGGRYVPKGFPLSVDSSKLSGREKNFVDAPGDLAAPATVEMSAVAPTGPNPKNPQQVPPGTIQTIEGHAIPGAKLVGERTQPEAERFAGDGKPGAQAQIAEALMDDSDKPAADLDKMTKAELVAEAGRRGIEIETDDNKADLIRKLSA